MNLYAISALVNFLTSLGLAGVVLRRNYRHPLNITFAMFAGSVAFWSFGYFFWQLSVEAGAALFWARFLMLGAILIPPTYLHLVLALTNRTKLYRFLLFGSYTLFAIFLSLNATPLFVREVAPVFLFPFWPVPGVMFHIFLALWSLYIVFTTYVLYASYTRAVGSLRLQLKYVFLGMVVGFAGGSTNYFLWYGIPIPPIANIAVSFYVLTLGYAVLKYHLFSVKVIAAELFTYLLWILLLARTLLSQTWQEQVINGVLFVAALIFGALLIRSVIREVEQRERIEKLALDLEAANERLQELDQLKSEFVSLATHQIRGPLTAIMGYASMMLQGDFGPLSDNLRASIQTIFESSNSLTGIVQDFLDVSRIEQGRMKYEMTVFDLGRLARAVSEELLPNIEPKGLRVRLEIEDGLMVYADAGKIRQVIENLIDNAVKYTGQGTITITAAKKGEKALLSVRDTGVGIAQETLPHLFKKFSRASDASKANLKGTGLGLYVAKQLIEAQGGKIWAESEGEGKGATFSVELPLKM